MIRVEENSAINKIVREIYIPDCLSDKNPIIAGGSILHLYLHLKDEGSELYRRMLSEYEKWARKSVLVNPVKIHNKNVWLEGDIDLWFDTEEAISEAIGRAEADAKGYYNKRRLTVKHKPSNWAVSFLMNQDNRFLGSCHVVQIIKNPASSPESLIASFDMVNSMIAWQNGKLYIDDRLDEAFADGMIRYANNPFEKEMTIASKLFNALRLFKYADRYALSFSEEIDSIILGVYLEADDVDLSKYEQRIELAASHYGRKYSSVNNVKSMMEALSRHFETWYSMKTFREENLAFFVSLQKDEFKIATRAVKEILTGEEQPLF